MHLSITTSLIWHCAEPTDILLQLEVAATADQRLLASALTSTPSGHFTRVPAQDGIGERIWLHQEGDCTVTYSAEVAVLRRSVPLEMLAALPPHRLPGEAVPYLMDSHYCPANRFSPFVDEEFAAFEGGAKVAAMRDWIAAHFRYVPGVSNASTTAIDSFVERAPPRSRRALPADTDPRSNRRISMRLRKCGWPMPKAWGAGISSMRPAWPTPPRSRGSRSGAMRPTPVSSPASDRPIYANWRSKCMRAHKVGTSLNHAC